MKQLHRPDLYGWSVFDESRNMDFNSVLWVRRDTSGKPANVAVDPLPLSKHDFEHLQSLGGLGTIVITNSDHVRDAVTIRQATGATLCGPAAERATFPVPCDKWLSAGEQPVGGLVTYTVEGGKTPGELALLLEQTTLITGDLIRSHAGGRLDSLPAPKLANVRLVIDSLRQLLRIDTLSAVLPGDGWPAFYGARRLLEELLSRVELEAN